MAKPPIAIWGASGHALVVSDIVKLRGQYEIGGFIDDVNINRKGETFADKPIWTGGEVFSLLKQKGIEHVVLGFGHCSGRVDVADRLKRNGFRVLTVIHPDAVISSNVTIGEGTIVMAGVIIDPGCKIGRYAVINNSAIISHGSTIDDGVHICPGVSLGGNVHVEPCSWIGIGSCVTEDLCVGARSYVGAGSVVIRDIPSDSLAYGNPARVKGKITTSF